MKDLDLESPWIFTAATISLWILIFTVVEVGFTDGSLQSGIIQGFTGGLAFAIVYQAIQKFSK